jgi:hypothetical protein
MLAAINAFHEMGSLKKHINEDAFTLFCSIIQFDIHQQACLIAEDF